LRRAPLERKPSSNSSGIFWHLLASSVWTLYSYLNSILKQKYGFKLQDLPRMTMFIKGFEEDTKKKASSLYSRRWRSTSFWRRIPRCAQWLAWSLCLCLPCDK
jgi:hypothetical protein